MKITSLGKIEGYTHKEIKMSTDQGIEGLRELSIAFYSELAKETEGKTIIWRVVPTVSSEDGQIIICIARFHVKDE